MKKNSRRSYSQRSHSSGSNIFQNKKVMIGLLAALAVVLVAAIGIVIAMLIPKDPSFDEDTLGIHITKLPETTFYVGEKASYDGIEITVIRKNGETYTVGKDECQFSGFDNTKAVEKQTVTVTYRGHTDTYTVKIKPFPTDTPILTGIRIGKLPNKTEYKLGVDWLDTEGGVLIREYSNAEDAPIAMTNTMVDADAFFSITTTGTHQLTVWYSENGFPPVQTTFEITVTE